MKDDTSKSPLLGDENQTKNYGASPLDAYDDDGRTNSKEDDGPQLGPTSDEKSIWSLVCILSTAFAYGCIMTTLFIITLPMECARIHHDHNNIPKSVALGNFVAIAGVTQLISPLVGRLSDMYVPPSLHEIGQRMPYLLMGSGCTVVGLVIQIFASYRSFWVRYSLGFFLHMIGLNIMYAMMIALIPDQVPEQQVGVANGILALLLVTGSLFGFGLFYSILEEYVGSMYGLYTCIVIVTSILTATHAHEQDAELAAMRTERHQQRLSLRVTSPPSATMGERKPSFGQLLHKKAQQIHKKARQIVLTPAVIVKSVLVEPFHKMDWRTLWSSYTIDRQKHYDFFIVTVSRLFYYCGLSAQTFFLYFVHDILNVHKDPESVVAALAIVSQVSGACTCYPVGVLSDRYLHGRRKPFVYVACIVLASATFSLIFAKTLHDMVIVCMVLGASNGVYLTMDTSLAVDTLPLPSEEDDEDGDGSAQLLGVWGVAAFLGSALGPMIGGPLLYLFGSQYSSSSSGEAGTQKSTTEDESPSMEEYSLKGYAIVLCLSSFYFLCSAVSLRFIKGRHDQ